MIGIASDLRLATQRDGQDLGQLLVDERLDNFLDVEHFDKFSLNTRQKTTKKIEKSFGRKLEFDDARFARPERMKVDSLSRSEETIGRRVGLVLQRAMRTYDWENLKLIDRRSANAVTKTE